MVTLRDMSGTENADWMRGVTFYAQKTRANGRLAGTIAVVSKYTSNGRLRAAVMVPPGDRNALPVCTWVDLIKYAGRYVEVTAEQAAQMHPQILAYVTKYQRSPEFRAMHAHEARRTVVSAEGTAYGPYRERSPLQRATTNEGLVEQ